MKPFLKIPLVAVLLSTVAGPVRAQSLDRGLELFESEAYERAAVLLHDVALRGVSAPERNEAVFYLASSLQRMGFWAPASFYYKVILERGADNRRFLDAVEELLAIQSQYHDHIFVIDLVDTFFNGEAFANLPNGERVDQINFLMGEYNLRRGRVANAGRFLEFVRSGTSHFANALYLLGLVSLQEGNAAEALDYFELVEDAFAEGADESHRQRLGQLAQLAIARAAYGLGRFDQALEAFGSLPRYGEFWFQALYEQAWAHYQTQDYGRALGALETVLSPYFATRHVPEAYVIQATTYFSVCQWDRVRRSVERYSARYAPMKEQLDAYLASSRSPEQILDDLSEGGAGEYAEEIAREVRRVGWFKDLFFVIQHLSWQRSEIERIEAFRGSRLGSDIELIIRDSLENARVFAGAWARQRLVFHAENLRTFQNQIDILDFEVADAERQWLEQGREILKGRRARLPRPKIPSDQWQHWSMEREYWRDELGFYQHTIQSECN